MTLIETKAPAAELNAATAGGASQSAHAAQAKAAKPLTDFISISDLTTLQAFELIAQAKRIKAEVKR